MRPVFTILLLLIVSFFSYGQRGEPDLVETFDAKSLKDPFYKDSDTIMLWPGVTGDIDNEWALYRYGFEEGFAFGTNIHNDQAFGQHFSVEEPYKIVGGRFWFPGKEGEEGHIVITVWDMADGTPGEPLYEEGFYFANVPQRMNLPFSWVVEFSESVRVEKDYLIGVNVSNLKEYEHSTGTQDGELIYGLGNVSSYMGDGGENWLAWVKQEDGDWVNTKEFGDDGWDLDIGIFPYVIYEDDGGTEGYHEITFNLDMEDAVAVGDVDFDPEIHDVYIAGSFADWVRPGEDDSFRMQPGNNSGEDDGMNTSNGKHYRGITEGQLPDGYDAEEKSTNNDVYTITLEVEEGNHEYKYFLVEDTPTWDLEEYEADHYRSLTVEAPAVVSDTWGEDPTVDAVDLISETEIRIFPNPSSGRVNVLSDVEIDEIRVYDISGNMVKQLQVGHPEYYLNISNLSPGVYILQVRTATGLSTDRIHLNR